MLAVSEFKENAVVSPVVVAAKPPMARSGLIPNQVGDGWIYGLPIFLCRIRVVSKIVISDGM